MQRSRDRRGYRHEGAAFPGRPSRTQHPDDLPPRPRPRLASYLVRNRRSPQINFAHALVTGTSSALWENAPVFQSGSGPFADGTVGHVALVDGLE